MRRRRSLSRCTSWYFICSHFSFVHGLCAVCVRFMCAGLCAVCVRGLCVVCAWFVRGLCAVQHNCDLLASWWCCEIPRGGVHSVWDVHLQTLGERLVCGLLLVCFLVFFVVNCVLCVLCHVRIILTSSKVLQNILPFHCCRLRKEFLLLLNKRQPGHGFQLSNGWLMGFCKRYLPHHRA